MWPPPTSPTTTTSTTPCRRRRSRTHHRHHSTAGVDSAGVKAGWPAAVEDRVERAAIVLLAAWQSVRTSPASGRNESKRHEE